MIGLQAAHVLQVLRVFVGEGDQYAGWHDIAVDLVAWYEVNATTVAQYTTEEGVVEYLASLEDTTMQT